MKNKEAELLYEQAKAAAHQQNLEAALAQHAQVGFGPSCGEITVKLLQSVTQ